MMPRVLIRALFILVAAGSIVTAPLAAAAAVDAGAAALRARHAQLREQLRNNPFQRALHIDSSEQQEGVQGDVYAVLEHSFATVSEALREPAQWCAVMILPFNTKYCHAAQGSAASGLQVRIGRKFDQPLDQAHRLDFNLRNVAGGPDYFESRLNAATGPMGTRDYRIHLAAIPLDKGRTFMHLSYSYGVGMLGRMAMQGYLSTVGADKIGFSAAGADGNGRPKYIGGVRGAVERNAMRYYLAIDAYLDSLSTPTSQQVERRIQNWFTATERYPRQLREMDRTTYVSMKRLEWERQQSAID
jgi:hypothetical protein